MGYVADRINRELVDIDVSGVDISATAVERAQTMFPNINFEVFDIINDVLLHTQRHFGQQFDIVMVKSVLWYVLEKLDIFWTNLEHMTSKFIYICQSFSEQKNFYGSDIFPDACALEQYVGKRFDIQYSALRKMPVIEIVN